MTQTPTSRYSTRPFPPYTYIPGSGTPHPVSDPRGHMHGQEVAAPDPLDPHQWRENETFLYAVDLFNHGYFWEAHEAWESLWHAAGHRGQMADFLKGLIKLAAAGVKQCENNSVGVRRHLRRGQELLTAVGDPTYCGVNILELISHAVESSSSGRDYSVQIILEGPNHACDEEDVAREA